MIDKFEGEHRFLSNFYPSTVEFEGLTYPSVEHAYQAAKTLDPAIRLKISQAKTPAAAKKAGKSVDLRPDWEEVKLSIMRELVREKFDGTSLESLLCNTGDETLIEGNWWGDTFWGVCKGEGQNHLGKILMSLRKELNGDFGN